VRDERAGRRRAQRDYMRKLVRRFGPDEERVIREYAAAEERGEVERKRVVLQKISDYTRYWGEPLVGAQSIAAKIFFATLPGTLPASFGALDKLGYAHPWLFILPI
jgi:hypothetical protein